MRTTYFARLTESLPLPVALYNKGKGRDEEPPEEDKK